MTASEPTSELDASERRYAKQVYGSIREVRARFSSRRLDELSFEQGGTPQRLSLSAAQVLVALATEEQLSAAELGRALHVEREGCSKAIKELRTLGLVSQLYGHPQYVGNHDPYELTETGVAAVRAILR